MALSKNVNYIKLVDSVQDLCDFAFVQSLLRGVWESSALTVYSSVSPFTSWYVYFEL